MNPREKTYQANYVYIQIWLLEKHPMVFADWQNHLDRLEEE